MKVVGVFGVDCVCILVNSVVEGDGVVECIVV